MRKGNGVGATGATLRIGKTANTRRCLWWTKALPMSEQTGRRNEGWAESSLWAEWCRAESEE
jgi:hypothetical protein